MVIIFTIVAAIQLLLIAWFAARSKANKEISREWKRKYYLVRQDLDNTLEELRNIDVIRDQIASITEAEMKELEIKFSSYDK